MSIFKNQNHPKCKLHSHFGWIWLIRTSSLNFKWTKFDCTTGLILQSNLDISSSDISNSAKLEASIWIKMHFDCFSQIIIWRWRLLTSPHYPKCKLNCTSGNLNLSKIVPSTSRYRELTVFGWRVSSKIRVRFKSRPPQQCFI